MQVCEIVEAMQADTDTAPSRILVDGGMTQSELLLQLQSNLLGMEVHKPSIKEVNCVIRMFLCASLGFCLR